MPYFTSQKYNCDSVSASVFSFVHSPLSASVCECVLQYVGSIHSMLISLSSSRCKNSRHHIQRWTFNKHAHKQTYSWVIMCVWELIFLLCVCVCWISTIIHLHIYTFKWMTFACLSISNVKWSQVYTIKSDESSKQSQKWLYINYDISTYFCTI